MDSCQSFCINLSVPPFIYISIKILISIYISSDSRISTWSLKIFEFKVGISGEDWTELDTNWQKVATQVSCLSIDLFIYFYINLSMNHLSIYIFSIILPLHRCATGSGCLTPVCPGSLARSGSGSTRARDSSTEMIYRLR